MVKNWPALEVYITNDGWQDEAEKAVRKTWQTQQKYNAENTAKHISKLQAKQIPRRTPRSLLFQG